MTPKRVEQRTGAKKDEVIRIRVSERTKRHLEDLAAARGDSSSRVVRDLIDGAFNEWANSLPVPGS